MQWRLITPGMVLVAGCGIPTTIGYLHLAEQNQAAYLANERDAQQRQLAQELPDNPPDLADTPTEFIALGEPTGQTYACLLFSTTTHQLATTLHTTTCPTTIQALHHQVIDPNTYINQLAVATDAWSTTGDTGSTDARSPGIGPSPVPSTPPGRLLGHLTWCRC